MSDQPMPRLLVTGATGFIGCEVTRQLVQLGLRPLVAARFRSYGSTFVSRLADYGLVKLVKLDLERPDLGLSRQAHAALTGNVSAVLNVAASYDLDGNPHVIQRTNVDGLRHLAERATRWGATTFHQVSSIAAAGRLQGPILEKPLPQPPGFRNAYEKSKYDAEAHLLETWHGPVRIYRLGIVVGESATGATSKFDGPYPAFTLIKRWLPFPLPGSGERTLPLINVDLVADVLTKGVLSPPEGREFLHLIDLEAPTVKGFARAMTARLAGHRRLWQLPAQILIAAWLMPGMARLTGLSQNTVQYMHTLGSYDTREFAAFSSRHRLCPARLRRSYDALALYYAISQHRRFAKPSHGGHPTAATSTPASLCS